MPIPSCLRIWTAGVAFVVVACGSDSKARRPSDDSGSHTGTGGTDGATTGGGPIDFDSGTPRPPIMVSPDAAQPGVKPPVGNRVIHVGGVPAEIEQSFQAAAPRPGNEPALVYPAPDTMFPPNIARILFQFTAPAGNAFHVHFDSGKGTLDVYTDGVHDTCTRAGTGARCWESGADTLLPYLDAAAGGTLKFDISSLDTAAPSTRAQSPTYSVRVAPHRVGGAIYYWSTTAQGVRRGTLDGRPAADYLTPPAAKGQCVACHTLSRSGKHLTIALPGDLLGLVDVVETIPPILFGPSSQGFPGENIAASWATFSPDDAKIVVAGQGVLSVRDAKTAQLAGGPIVLPPGMTGSMPDWSPDGKHLVFASSMDATPDRVARHLQGSSIAWLATDGTNFSGLETIAQSRGVVSTMCSGKESYANPMFTPDSKWLAFSRGDCESEADPSSEILMAPAAANAMAVHLVRANTQVGPSPLDHLQNGMPTWAPSHDDDIGWIAFTSARDYGLVLTQGSQIGVQMHQLWIAAIDFKQIGNGDPSFPAFRLPAQDLNENNHRPFWTVDVLPPDWTPPIVH